MTEEYDPASPHAPRAGAFATPIDDRYFEDYLPGAVHRFGEMRVSEREIIEFARRYDPQDFHTDPAKAADTMFGGLIASGWMTCGLMMRMYAEHYLSANASLSSPGLDELRWLVPVRPDDVLSTRVTVIEARRSASKPDRGIVRSKIEVLNQRGEVVLSMLAINLVGCRTAPEA
ncbi:MaoC family dehydratase [Thauera aromatica]|uniref:MaoC family dehydratase n=1 Tax=Thauera aromatica TaxID=59405 RepID=UPI001FFD4F42|nr:MaoC family dehydratase [Thauera aromatica]MCK2089655.1 MaoC family dehydratase [Thauera aromatica]